MFFLIYIIPHAGNNEAVFVPVCDYVFAFANVPSIVVSGHIGQIAAWTHFSACVSH